MTTPMIAGDAQTLHRLAMHHVRQHGVLIGPDRSESVLGDQAYHEAANVELRLLNPRARSHSGAYFRFTRAALRSLWILAAQDSTRTLSALFPTITQFSDNGDALAGSAIGVRLQQPSGSAQLAGVISRLSATPNTRRATATLFFPEDASAQSHDIPCLLSVSWHIRNDKLQCTSVMRANNVVRLMPYNLFDLTMLTECIAVRIGRDLGPHIHYVISLHAYESDFGEIVNADGQPDITPPDPMEPMPTSVEPFAASVAAYAIAESAVAAIRSGDDLRGAEDFHARCDALHPYWANLVRPIVYEVASRLAIDSGLWITASDSRAEREET